MIPHRFGCVLGNGCKLLSNALVVNLVATDALGSAVDVLRVPITPAGTTFHHFLPLGLVGTSGSDEMRRPVV